MASNACVRSRVTGRRGELLHGPEHGGGTPLAAPSFTNTCRGILTGIGIVGTFFGLMLGLQRFDLEHAGTGQCQRR